MAQESGLLKKGEELFNPKTCEADAAQKANLINLYCKRNRATVVIQLKFKIKTQNIGSKVGLVRLKSFYFSVFRAESALYKGPVQNVILTIFGPIFFIYISKRLEELR